MSRRLAAALVGVVAIAALAGCGSDGDDEPAATTAPGERTTTTAEPTTTAGPTTTRPTPTPCPPIAVPPGASDVTEAPVELDGDGAPDVVRTFLVGDSWVLQVAVGAGGGAELPLAGTDFGAVGLVGGADVDGDGRDEVWARIGSGASATILGLVRYDGCALTRVTWATGQTAEMPVGGSVGSAAGVECRSPGVDADLTTFTALHRDDGVYDVVATSFELEGTTLVERSSSAEVVAADDADFVRHTSFTCHDLAL